MKNILLLAAILFLSSTSLKAQENESKINRFYVFGGAGGALFEGSATNIGVSAVINRKWIATIGHLNAERRASAPSDVIFRSSEYLLWIFPVSENHHPIAETQFTYLSFGRYYPSTKRVSYILDAGIGLAKGQDYNYYQWGTTSLKGGEQIIPGASNTHIVTTTDRTSLGIIARAGMDWAFSGGAGMGFDVYYNLCTGGISDNVGINFRLNIGYMPRKGKNAMKQ